MSIKKVLVSAMVLGLVSSANATELKAANQSVQTNLCLTAASGNKAAMHNQIKASGYSKQFVAEKVQCNGNNILAFVEKHGKNSENMINLIDQKSRQVSITDIAKNTITEKN